MLTFKVQHALKALPDPITALQAEVDRLGAALADPELCAQSRAVPPGAAALAAAKERWLALKTMREENGRLLGILLLSLRHHH